MIGKVVGAAILMGLLGLFAWHVAWLSDCRNYGANGDLISGYYFLKAGCPHLGPYAPNDNVLIYALLSIAGVGVNYSHTDPVALGLGAFLGILATGLVVVELWPTPPSQQPPQTMVMPPWQRPQPKSPENPTSKQ